MAKPKGPVRQKKLTFRVSDDEYELIEEKRESLGIRNKEAYLRKMAIDGYCVKLDLQEIREMTKLMRATSNNLNQYARWANESGKVHTEDMRDLRERFEQIYEAEKAILASLQILS